MKWSLKYHDGTRNEPQMDDEVVCLASIAYYLQPMAHRSFSAYNYVCELLQESLHVCPSASPVVAGGSAGHSFGSNRFSVTAVGADSPESK